MVQLLSFVVNLVGWFRSRGPAAVVRDERRIRVYETVLAVGPIICGTNFT